MAGRPLRVALAIPARDKRLYVAETVKQALAQTYPHIEFLFSDQGSVDGTYEVMENACRGYDGPGTVRLLRCPVVPRKSMVGLMAHINWLHEQTDADIICMLSADDFIYPRYVERVVEAVQKGASYVACAKHYRANDGEIEMQTPFDWEDRFCSAVDHLAYLIGGSTLGAWTRELWNEWGPLEPTELVDVALPWYAGLTNRLYYVSEILAAYVKRPDPENTGMETRLRLAKNERESTAWTETTHYQLMSNLMTILRKMKARDFRADNDTFNHLYLAIHMRAVAWTEERDSMERQRISPKLLP